MYQPPSVGRIVHYMSYGTPGGEFKPECRAAIVTAADNVSMIIDLCVLNPTGMFFNQNVRHGEGSCGVKTDGGTWHWPERV